MQSNIGVKNYKNGDKYSGEFKNDKSKKTVLSNLRMVI